MDGLGGMGLETWVLGRYRTIEAFVEQARDAFEVMAEQGSLSLADPESPEASP